MYKDSVPQAEALQSYLSTGSRGNLVLLSGDSVDGNAARGGSQSCGRTTSYYADMV